MNKSYLIAAVIAAAALTACGKKEDAAVQAASAAASDGQHLDLFCLAHRVRAFGIDCPDPCWDSPFLGRP